jgi:2-desacetyl-2-hydroxyethyl bacteriochlorophyllide A dehydrogenase
MKSSALWHLNKSLSSIKQETLPILHPSEVLIESQYSLISTGTEKLVASGKVPPSMKEKMRVPFMGGDFHFPIKYGYSLVGQVLSKGAYQDQLVHLLHPHQNKLITDNQSFSLIPKNIPAKRAALASNMETAINAIWDAHISLGDKVLLVGFGMIGGLIARVLSLMPTVEINILETNPYRLQLAKEMGFNTAISHEAYDVSFHTSGTSMGLQKAIEAVGMEGKIIELSWYGTQSVTLQLGADFHQQRKQLISSQVGHIPFYKSARWDFKRRKELVFKLLENPLFDQHISHEIKFEETPEFFKQLRNDAVKNKGLGWVIKY